MNQQIADDIKLNEEKIKTIDRAIELVEENNPLSTFLPRTYELRSRKWKLEAANEMLEYYQSKLGEREELKTDRHLSVYVSGAEAEKGISLRICLDDDTVDKLYDRVWSSYSDISTFFESHFYELSRHILHFDLGLVSSFLSKFGYDPRFKEYLHSSKEDFDRDVRVAKRDIDKIFELFENKKLMDRVEDALDAYLNAVFESNPKERRNR
jgi:hypothetical protein